MGVIFVFSILFSLIFSLVLTPLIRNLALKIHAYRKTETKTQQEPPFDFAQDGSNTSDLRLSVRPECNRRTESGEPLDSARDGSRGGELVEPLVEPHIPYLGGLSVFFSFFIVALFMSFHYGQLSPEFMGIFIGSMIIVILGLVDDFVELSPAAKLLGQTLAVITLIIFGITTKIVAIGWPGNILVTFFWVLAMINSLNLLDIMDGLCSGVTIIAAGAFLVVSFLSENILAFIFCSILIGTGLGFLRYNLPPAKIYLGDTGSMFCGFILAAIAIIIDYAPLKREIALLTPILVLGLPLFDTAFVILMRLLHGRPVVRKSRDHFALRLLSAGWSKGKILLLMYIFGLFFAGSALLISRVSNQHGILILIAILLICGIALGKIGTVKIDA